MSIAQLLKRLHVEEDGLVVIQEPIKLSPLNKRKLLLDVQKAIGKGTVGVLADCKFNVDVMDKDFDKVLSNQERLVLASGHLLQLLTLQPQCQYTNHPSLMFGSVGKYSSFLSRFTSLDFPYGNPSIFQDFYDLNAVLLLDDIKESLLFAYPYIVGQYANPVICKNTSYFDYELEAYLDYDVEACKLKEFPHLEELFIYETFADGTRIYGISFRELVDVIALELKK